MFKIESVATALNQIEVNIMLAMLLLVLFMPLVLLIHVIAMFYFQTKGYYRSKSFMLKHLLIGILFPIAGMALITFEYIVNLNTGGIHVGTFLSVLFVYGFLSLIFAIPYTFYLSSTSKTS